MTETGMPERLSGTGEFLILWHFDGTHWEMTRAFSIDHQPVAYQPPPPSVILDAEMLRRYVGRYHFPSSGEVTISIENGKLTLTTNNLHLTFAAKTVDHFFALERPLQLEFQGSLGGKAESITVIENGAPVESGKRDD